MPRTSPTRDRRRDRFRAWGRRSPPATGPMAESGATAETSRSSRGRPGSSARTSRRSTSGRRCGTRCAWIGRAPHGPLGGSLRTRTTTRSFPSKSAATGCESSCAHHPATVGHQTIRQPVSSRAGCSGAPLRVDRGCGTTPAAAEAVPGPGARSGRNTSAIARWSHDARRPPAARSRSSGPRVGVCQRQSNSRPCEPQLCDISSTRTCSRRIVG